MIGVAVGGDHVRLERDARGQVVALAGRTGARHVLHRDSRGSMVEYVSPAGARTRVTHDAEQRIVSQVDAMRTTRRVTRDAVGRIVEVAGPRGHRVELTYGPRGSLIRAQAAETTVTLERDPLERPTRERCGPFEVRRTYGPTGATARVDTSLGLSVDLHPDTAGRLVGASTRAVPWTVRRVLDAAGRERERTIGDALRVLQERDAMGRVTLRRIEWRGRELSRTEYRYGSGRLLGVRSTHGVPTTYEYDHAGNLIASSPTGCDVRRGMTVAKDCSSPLYEVDDAGRVVQTDRAQYAYDAAGRRVLRRDAEGRVTHYEWDAAGRLATVHQEGARTVRYAYDALGRPRRRSTLEDGKERARELHWDGLHLVHEVEGNDLVSWIWLDGQVAGCLSNDRALTFLSHPRGVITEVVDAQGTLLFSPTGDPLASTFQRASSVHQPWCGEGHWFDPDTGLAMTPFRFYDPEVCAYLSPHPFGPAAGWNAYGIPVPSGGAMSRYGLATGLQPFLGAATPSTLDRELVELTIAALEPTRSLRDDPLAIAKLDPWAHAFGLLAPHLPSSRLAVSSPFQLEDTPRWMPAFEPIHGE